jgi:hypothetical protein
MLVSLGRGKRCKIFWVAAELIAFRCFIDPLVHRGRHFGRTIHALFRVQALLTNGIIHGIELDATSEETLSFEYVVLKK